MNHTLHTPSNENETEQETERAQNEGANRLDPRSEPSLIEKAVYNDKTISEEEVFQVLFGQRSGRNRKASPYRPNPNNNANPDKDTIKHPNRLLERPKSWHGIYPERARSGPPRIHNINCNIRCAPFDPAKYSYNTSEYGCPYRPPNKPIVSWVACAEGRVQPGAIVAGREFNNPYTFIGRVTLRNEQCIGRIVPMARCCYFIRKGMEHKRFTYEVLVNASSRGLVWRRDYSGHVPDTAIEMGSTMVQINSRKSSDNWFSHHGAHIISSGCNPFAAFTRHGEQYYRKSGISRQWETAYFGRTRINKGVIIPGYVVPSHGVLHSGYDNRETVRDEYEVLCEDHPCTLKYLVSKKIRDQLKSVEMIHRQKYSTKVQNALSNIERLLAPICRKELPKHEPPEEKLELPNTLVNYLKSPRNPNVTVVSRLDFNTIMNHCCSLDENCPCSMWVDIGLQGVL